MVCFNTNVIEYSNPNMFQVIVINGSSTHTLDMDSDLGLCYSHFIQFRATVVSCIDRLAMISGCSKVNGGLTGQGQ